MVSAVDLQPTRKVIEWISYKYEARSIIILFPEAGVNTTWSGNPEQPDLFGTVYVASSHGLALYQCYLNFSTMKKTNRLNQQKILAIDHSDKTTRSRFRRGRKHSRKK
jgi:hypothetical protein